MLQGLWALCASYSHIEIHKWRTGKRFVGLVYSIVGLILVHLSGSCTSTRQAHTWPFIGFIRIDLLGSHKSPNRDYMSTMCLSLRAEHPSRLNLWCLCHWCIRRWNGDFAPSNHRGGVSSYKSKN